MVLDYEKDQEDAEDKEDEKDVEDEGDEEELSLYFVVFCFWNK